jgi:CDP-4-dehydro-6-deoxyglucose reductase, E3
VGAHRRVAGQQAQSAAERLSRGACRPLRISLYNSARSFSAAPGQSLLDAALGAGLNVPHSCVGGNCGSCRARLLQGEIEYPNGRPLGLSDSEAAQGYILLCQARARGDLCIEAIEPTSPEEAVIKRLPARIEKMQPLCHDVMAVYLRLPAAEPFSFEAGQYIDIILPGGRRRSFSIASPPHDSRLLELHVRRVAGGELTTQLFSEASRNALLTIEGPLGQFHCRGDGPMLLIGGGTGLAPLYSMVRHLLEKGPEREMTLYWGVRGERDLYAHAALEELARRGQLRYVPVLSEPAAAWTGRRGWVHEAVIHDIADFGRYDVYASGPPEMTGAVRRELGLRGVPAERISTDSFDYAPDSVERHRTSSATRS